MVYARSSNPNTPSSTKVSKWTNGTVTLYSNLHFRLTSVSTYVTIVYHLLKSRSTSVTNSCLILKLRLIFVTASPLQHSPRSFTSANSIQDIVQRRVAKRLTSLTISMRYPVQLILGFVSPTSEAVVTFLVMANLAAVRNAKRYSTTTSHHSIQPLELNTIIRLVNPHKSKARTSISIRSSDSFVVKSQQAMPSHSTDISTKVSLYSVSIQILR
jgi:hypothetical protein